MSQLLLCELFCVKTYQWKIWRCLRQSWLDPWSPLLPPPQGPLSGPEKHPLPPQNVTSSLSRANNSIVWHRDDKPSLSLRARSWKTHWKHHIFWKVLNQEIGYTLYKVFQATWTDLDWDHLMEFLLKRNVVNSTLLWHGMQALSALLNCQEDCKTQNLRKGKRTVQTSWFHLEHLVGKDFGKLELSSHDTCDFTLNAVRADGKWLYKAGHHYQPNHQTKLKVVQNFTSSPPFTFWNCFQSHCL